MTARRLTATYVAALGVMAMTACGSAQPGGDTGTTPGGTAATQGSSAAPSTASTDAVLEERAKSRLLPEDAFPEPWRLSQPPQPGFGLTVCGVDIEPEPAQGSALRRFTQSALGPFLVQYVQVHRDGMADEVVTKLKAALPGCTSFETKGEAPDSPTSRFTVDEVSFGPVPDNAVIWRMTSEGERPVTQDIALVADGEFLIGLVSFASGKTPDPAVVTTAVDKLPAGS